LWLKLLIEHFFRDSEYALNGEISWNGEEPGDCSPDLIVVSGKAVEGIRGVLSRK